MKKINARLLAVANLIRGDIIADIGSDHAYLPAWLVKHGRIKKAYAIDISANCVERIKANLARFNISWEIIEPVLSDGLPELENLSDIVIAGMGARSIMNIISGIKNPSGINFILQTHTKKDLLKDFLLSKNFKISHEIIVQDKKRFYNIIAGEFHV